MKTTLSSAFAWSAAQTAIRLVVGFLSIKVTAVYLGTAGIALTSQLNSIVSLLRGLIGNAIDDGVVTLIAKQDGQSRSARREIISTASRWIACTSAIVAIIIIIFADKVSLYLLGSTNWIPLVWLVAFILPVSLIGQLYLSVLSGLKRFDLVSIVQIGMTLGGASLLIAFSISWGLSGGLVATLLAYSITLLFALLVSSYSKIATLGDLAGKWSPTDANVIFSFYPMVLAHAAMIPLATLFVRSVFIDRFGPDQTGLWQSALRLSDMYTMIVATALNMYSLPTLAAANARSTLRRELVLLVLQICGGMLLLTAVLFVLRHWIVSVVFTPAFEPVGDIWKFQLVADIFLLASVPLRQVLMVRQRVRLYIIAELQVALTFVAGSCVLMKTFGVEAATISSAIAWIACFCLLVWLNRGVLFGAKAAER